MRRLLAAPCPITTLFARAGIFGVVLASGCNAVFGLSDVDFGSGGGDSGESASTTTSSTPTSSGTASGAVSSGDASSSESSSSSADASSSASSAGEGGGSSSSAGGGSSSSGSGGACEVEPTDLANVGSFNPGWDAFWSNYNATTTIEDQGGQPVLHVVSIDDEDETSISDSLDGDDVCIDACLRARFSLYVNSAFTLNVIVEDDDTGVRMAVMVDTMEPTGSFDIIESDACRMDAGAGSPDRNSYVADPGGADFLIDDVELLVEECDEAAPPCLVFE